MTMDTGDCVFEAAYSISELPPDRRFGVEKVEIFLQQDRGSILDSPTEMILYLHHALNTLKALAPVMAEIDRINKER